MTSVFEISSNTSGQTHRPLLSGWGGRSARLSRSRHIDEVGPAAEDAHPANRNLDIVALLRKGERHTSGRPSKMTVSNLPLALPDNGHATPDNKVTVLLVSNAPEDSVRLRNIFQHTNWELLCARDAKEADAVLLQRSIPVVLTTPQFASGATWRDLLDSAPAGVQPRVIVTAPDLNDQLWAEVLNLGGYDVLMKPFDHSEVTRIVSLAWLNWRDEVTAGHAPVSAKGSEKAQRSS